MPETFNYLSLFSGIPAGGLDLGLDRAGMTCVGQVELDPYCRLVLEKHWPEVPRHDDVRTAGDWWTAEPRPVVRLVAGGPPCQPASRSGHRLGANDPRWGWPWFLDVVRALGPEYVVMENPPAVLDLDGGAAFGDILGELAGLGFDAEWTVLSACAVGAPHTRERLFVVAHATGERWGGRRARGAPSQPVEPARRRSEPRWPGPAEPRPFGVAYGISGGMDRRRTLGNAVVPQVAQHVGSLIMEHCHAMS